MTDPYARLRQIVADPGATDDDLPDGDYQVINSPADIHSAGWNLSARMLRELVEDPQCAVQFRANLGEADSRRKGMNRLLRAAGDPRTVSVERTDPRAPGGVNRTSIWVARLNVGMRASA